MLSDGTNSLVWDARNHLTSMNGGTISFQYDPFGRRVSKTISGATTNYLYDGVNPVQELSGSTVTANLVTGGLDEYFTRTDSAGARNFLADPLGSTVALADSTGITQTAYTYEPFGNTTTGGTATANPYQFTGRENDGTGLYFYRARYYNPSSGRFISEDPLGFAANGANFYELAYHNPTNFRDPLGSQTTTVEPPAPAPAPPAPAPVAPLAPNPAPVPPPSVGVGLGNLLGAAAAIFAFPEDLNPNEPDPGARAKPRTAARKSCGSGSPDVPADRPCFQLYQAELASCYAKYTGEELRRFNEEPS
jgi:RHS repeat-associated protein